MLKEVLMKDPITKIETITAITDITIGHNFKSKNIRKYRDEDLITIQIFPKEINVKTLHKINR
jgi:hypothetical protein